MSSQSKAQVTHKRQWKAPQATHFNDDYTANNQETAEFNQKTGNFNSLVGEQEEAKVLTNPEKGKKNLFGGAKKNVFNPFAKKTGKAAGGSDSASFAKESNVDSEKKRGAGFGDNSFSGAGNQSKISSGGNASNSHENQDLGKKTAPALLQNFGGEGKKQDGKGIDEELNESNYEDDDFDLGSNMAKSDSQEKVSEGKDFFN